MALPDTFSSIRTDENGRAYVIHKPTGVIYYVRDQALTRGRAKGAKVRVYTPTAQHELHLPPRRKPGIRSEPDHCAAPPDRPAITPIARARFIPGSEPTS